MTGVGGSSDYQSIQSIVAELGGYRKGTVTVFIDLVRGFLTWRESNRWCNNFTRTISGEQVDALRDQLMACRLLAWRSLHDRTVATDEDEDGELKKPRLTWQVSVRHGNHCWQRSGENRLPRQWAEFRIAIENITRTNFSI